MKYWKYMEFTGWEAIKPKLNAWVDEHKIVDTGFFWNQVNLAQFLKDQPELVAALGRSGLKITYCAIIVARPVPDPKSHESNIHVDDMYGVAARLQLPIRNTEGSYTYFYSCDKKDVQRKVLPNGHAFWWVDPADAKEETRVCIDRPTVIRTGSPHAVKANSANPEPRVTATLRLNIDPVRYLI
jgi:hypothetical protein